ncbi:MAG TPA: phosphatidylserine decarboxylase family protein [Gemmatimonadaceae bacterium]|nr:phosphatidylserine decarboxylase family protein [Gemmatimonadaceae bacterium]
MKLAREGLPFVGLGVAAAAIMVWQAAAHRSAALWVAAALLVIVALWIVYFFRDPERPGPRGDRLVVAPADGRIVMITEVDEPAFVGARAVRVSIFMNIFNVHVNRYPVSGTVAYLHYNAGKFLNAAHEKASLENEQMSVGIDTGRERILVRQIAGLVARRIASYARLGARADQGERMGIIRFGSRVDVFVPPGSSLRVAVGDRSHAGITLVAELPS